MKKSRDLRNCQCDACGPNFSVNYDVANDEYICDECPDKEEEEEEEEESDFEELEETKEEQHIRRERGY
jgi:hypothetical protein